MASALARALDHDVRVGHVDLALGEPVGIARRGDAVAIGDGLELAIAALLTHHAVVVPLHEQEFHELLPV